jgi:hypothetical protein
MKRGSILYEILLGFRMAHDTPELPPRPAKGTGLPAAWMDLAGGKYLHYYDANTAQCGRWRSTEILVQLGYGAIQ